MNAYILEVKAKLKEDKNDKKLVSSLSKWDGTSPLYYNNCSFFNLCVDSSKSTVFFDKRKAIEQSKRIYKYNYERLIIENISILTIRMRLALPLDIRYSQIVER